MGEAFNRNTRPNQHNDPPLSFGSTEALLFCGDHSKVRVRTKGGERTRAHTHLHRIDSVGVNDRQSLETVEATEAVAEDDRQLFEESRLATATWMCVRVKGYSVTANFVGIGCNVPQRTIACMSWTVG